jgi:hypothetical protein
MELHERYSKLDEQDIHRRYIREVIDVQNKIRSRNSSHADVELELNMLVKQSNEKLISAGFANADAIIHENAVSYRRVDSTRPEGDGPSYEPYDIEGVVLGGYKGLSLLRDEIVHIVDIDNANVDENDPSGYAFISIDQPDKFTLVDPPELVAPEHEEIWTIIDAVDEAESLTDYTEIWERVQQLDQPLLDMWFLELIEQKVGLNNQRVICQLDRVYRVVENGTDKLHTSIYRGKMEGNGKILGFTTVPVVDEHVEGSRTHYTMDHYSSKRHLAISLECDSRNIYSIPINSFTHLRPADVRPKTE